MQKHESKESSYESSSSFAPSVSAVTGHSSSHAIIIGVSLAGMLTARPLSERFDRVITIARDRCPAGPVARLRAIVEELFPGVCAELSRRA